MNDEATSDDGVHPRDPEVGSVAEEAAKLFGAVTDWARDQRPADDAGDGAAEMAGDVAGVVGDLADRAAQALSSVGEHVATGAAECTYCPICRTVHVLRQASPEVRTHLATAASSFLQAVAGALSSLPPPSSRPAGRPASRPAPAHPDRSGSGSEFEQIDLDGEDP